MKTLKITFISMVFQFIFACSNPIEIVGEGDVKTRSGNSICMFEGDDPGETNCSKNFVSTFRAKVS